MPKRRIRFRRDRMLCGSSRFSRVRVFREVGGLKTQYIRIRMTCFGESISVSTTKDIRVLGAYF